MFVFVLALLLISSQFEQTASFSQWMTTDYCDRPIKVGTLIMNEAAIESDEISLSVFRNEEQLEDNSKYSPGETLVVKINLSKNTVIETENAKFERGGCEGTRVVNKASANLLLPLGLEASNPVIIRAAWAEGHSTVKISKDFILVPDHPLRHNSEEAVKESSIDPPAVASEENKESDKTAESILANQNKNFLRKRLEADGHVPSTDVKENELIKEKVAAHHPENTQNTPSLATVGRPDLSLSLKEKQEEAKEAAEPSIPVAAKSEGKAAEMEEKKVVIPPPRKAMNVPSLATIARPNLSPDGRSLSHDHQDHQDLPKVHSPPAPRPSLHTESITRRHRTTTTIAVTTATAKAIAKENAEQAVAKETAGSGADTGPEKVVPEKIVAEEREGRGDPLADIPFLPKKPLSFYETVKNKLFSSVVLFGLAILVLVYGIIYSRVAIIRRIRKLFNRPRMAE